ncbi:MAG: FtsW/RodA/SpoVE family cell cycle protein [Bdellovibrionales bacterium]|nr:FtsW/RodA/SpoVE family cell cycle protein [Bdellovibrionales bacterium]
MKLQENKDVDKFLQKVLEQVQFKQAHEEIKTEYLNHIEESARLGMSYGLSANDSIADAIRRMGAPIEIGNHLNRIHVPKIDLAILISTVILCLVGIYSLSSLGFAGSQTVWAVLGLSIAGLLMFTKPTHLIKASIYLYGLTFLLLAAAHLSGVKYLGQPYLSIGPLKLKVVDLSAVLFLISVTGLNFRIPEKVKWRIPSILVLSTLPLVYFVAIGSVSPGILYFASTIAMLVSTKLSWKPLAVFMSIGLLLLSISTKGGAFLTSENYTLLQTSEAHTDFIFHHIISSFPFVALVTVLAFGLLIARSITLAREIKNQFSSAIFNAVLVMISLGTLWGLASGLGYMPMPQTGVNLPFVSYGGSMMFAHLGLVGILLGIIRRKSLHF